MRRYFFLALWAGFAFGVEAANNVWTNPAGGSWETTANWSRGVLPGITDQVRVGSNGTYTVTVGSSAANTVPNTFTNSDLNVHGYGGGSPTLLMNYTNATAFVVTNSVQIGNGTLTFAAPNGSLLIDSIFPHAFIMNDNSAGGPTPGGTQGVLNVQSGLFDTGGRMILASGVGTLSTINVNGGTLLNRGNIRIANSGTAQINVNGGDVVFGQGIVGYVAGATGRIVLATGHIWLTNSASGTFGLGAGLFDSANHGYGELILSNGNFFSGNNTLLAIGSGTDSLGGGGVGVLNVYGGVHTNNARIRVAQSVSSTGTVVIAGGTWNAGDEWSIGTGSNAFGSLTISNGTFHGITPGGGRILVAGMRYDINPPLQLPYSSGQLNVAGGSIILDQSIGATSDAWVEIGAASNSTAALNVSSGLLRIQNNGAGLLVGVGNNTFFGNGATTNTAGTATATLTGGRVELFRLTALGNGVLSNRTGGLLQFLGADIVNGPTNNLIVDGGTLSYKGYTGLNVTGAVAKFSVVSGSALELDSSTNVNITGTYTLTNAPNNMKTLQLTGGGPRWQSDNLAVSSGATLRVTNATNARVAAVVDNSGTIQVDNSRITYEKPVTISGRYISDPSTNVFLTNVTVAAGGTLEGGAGDLFDFRKSLFIQSTNATGFNLRSSTVLFSGGGVHTNSISGVDRGTNTFVGDFSYGRLSITSTADQIFFTSGGGSEPTNALYVRDLDLLGSTNNVSKLDAPANIHIYYLLSEHDSFNAYLMDKTYTLASGGLLLPVVPEPSAFVFLAVVAVFFACRSRHGRRP